MPVKPLLTSCAHVSMSERERVTCSNLASTMINILVNNPLMGALDLSSLRIVSCGGSPLSQATYNKAVSMFACEFFISYGAHGYTMVFFLVYALESVPMMMIQTEPFCIKLRRHDRVLRQDIHVHASDGKLHRRP